MMSISIEGKLGELGVVATQQGDRHPVDVADADARGGTPSGECRGPISSPPPRRNVIRQLLAQPARGRSSDAGGRRPPRPGAAAAALAAAGSGKMARWRQNSGW